MTKINLGESGYKNPECPNGYAMWIEDGIWFAAPKVDNEKFGPHEYDNNHRCKYKCGCNMFPYSSDGPVDPFGACPMNPILHLPMKDLIERLKKEIKESEECEDPSAYANWHNRIGVLITRADAKKIPEVLDNELILYLSRRHGKGLILAWWLIKKTISEFIWLRRELLKKWWKVDIRGQSLDAYLANNIGMTEAEYKRDGQ